MSYQIETLRKDLEKAEAKIGILENYLITLKEQGINVPEDLLPKENEK